MRLINVTISFATVVLVKCTQTQGRHLRSYRVSRDVYANIRETFKMLSEFPVRNRYWTVGLVDCATNALPFS